MGCHTKTEWVAWIGAILLALASPAGRAETPREATVTLEDGRVGLDGAGVSVPGSPCCAKVHHPYEDSRLPLLSRKLEDSRPAKVALELPAQSKAGEPLTTLDLDMLLREVHRARVPAWELRLDGASCGAARFLEEPATIEAGDLVLAEHQDGSVRVVNVSQLKKRAPKDPPRKIALDIFMGMPLADLCRILQMLHGDFLRLGLNSGPY